MTAVLTNWAQLAFRTDTKNSKLTNEQKTELSVITQLQRQNLAQISSEMTV